MNRNCVRAVIALALCGFLPLFGCSSPSSSTVTPPPPTGTGNVATITVNTGPGATAGYPYVNGAFTSVTVCAPGSTTQCQTIDGVLVDTGSYGLRLLSSAAGGALTVSLQAQLDSSGNAIAECTPFESGWTWGPVETADVTIASETATSLPLQVMGDTNYPDSEAPTGVNCTDNGLYPATNYSLDALQYLGANGVLGVGNFVQDCGNGCTSNTSNPDLYYSCPGGTGASCTATTEALSAQVSNPVAFFSTDNNGVIVALPSVTAASVGTSISGSLIFGIGTESNNGLGSATVYDLDPNTGNFTTVSSGETYSDASFLDSGSNGLFFDPQGTDLASFECSDLSDYFYCPTSNEALSGTIEGFSNGKSAQVNFTVSNADAFFDSEDYGTDGVFNGLAGPFPGGAAAFDWGLPFFYGTNVFVAIDGASTSGGTGPYVAF
jgi:hypothetical protein